MSELPAFALTEQQKAYFDAFGFINLRGLFAPEIERIGADFDETFRITRAAADAEAASAAADAAERGRTGPNDASARDRLTEAFGSTPIVDTYEHLNFGGHRAIIPSILETSSELAWLKDDPRITGTVTSLMGPDHEYFGSDGNLFDCDTSWHWDTYGAPVERFHIKLLFYLDELDGTNGALRVLPGTNDHEEDYASLVRPGLFDREKSGDRLGITVEEAPAYVIDNEPGDLVVVNFRTAHATFNSGEGRRLFSLNYRQRDHGAAEVLAV
jgi:hypothetical protein